MNREAWKQSVNGRELDLWPVNAPIGDIAYRIGSNLPARVVLEPGDLTRYEFLLVPLAGDHLKWTGGYDAQLFYVAHVPVNLKSSGEFKAVCMSRECFPGDFATYQNEHTRHVMAAFHNAFREAYQTTCDAVSAGS